MVSEELQVVVLPTTSIAEFCVAPVKKKYIEWFSIKYQMRFSFAMLSGWFQKLAPHTCISQLMKIKTTTNMNVFCCMYFPFIDTCYMDKYFEFRSVHWVIVLIVIDWDNFPLVLVLVLQQLKSTFYMHASWTTWGGSA